MEFRVLIDIACLDILPKSGKRREEVLDFCSRLVDVPYEASDFQVVEPSSLRSVEVSEVAGYAVTWWVDAPVKRIIVIDIHRYK